MMLRSAATALQPWASSSGSVLRHAVRTMARSSPDIDLGSEGVFGAPRTPAAQPQVGPLSQTRSLEPTVGLAGPSSPAREAEVNGRSTGGSHRLSMRPSLHHPAVRRRQWPWIYCAR